MQAVSVNLFRIDVNRRLERRSEVCDHPTILLDLADVASFRISSPDAELEADFAGNTPYVVLCPPGLEIDSHYRKGIRETWKIELDVPSWRISKHNPSRVSLRYCNEEVFLPVMQHLSIEIVPDFRDELERVQRAAKEADPRNLWRASLGAAAILARVFDLAGAAETATLPAEKLRCLIDDDLSCFMTLEDLSERCGYSSDHLRVMFLKTFGLTPSQYRRQRRLELAMNLVRKSDLNVAEMASYLGFHYTSHFSKAFRSEFKMTPLGAVRRYRFADAAAGPKPGKRRASRH